MEGNDDDLPMRLANINGSARPAVVIRRQRGDHHAV